MISFPKKTKPILVWFVTGNLPPYFSGAGRNDLLLAPHCEKHGLELKLVTNRKNGELRKSKINGIAVIRMRMGNDHQLTSRLLGPLNFLKNLFLNQRPSIIRFRGFSFRIALMIFIIKTVYPTIKIVVQPAMLGGDDAHSIKSKPFSRFLMSQILRSDAIFSMNKIIRETYITEKYKRNKIFSVSNPVDLQKFRPMGAKGKKKYRCQVGLKENAFIFITSGILSTRKRQSFITKAFLLLLSITKNRFCYLIHMGPTAYELKKLGLADSVKDAIIEEKKIVKMLYKNPYRNQILLIGNQKTPEKYLKASDAFIHASIYEGKANVVNEALACGLPTIVPDNPLYCEQVPKTSALFFKERSLQGLSKVMKKILENIELREKLKTNSREYARSKIDPKIVSKEYSQLLCRVALSNNRN